MNCTLVTVISVGYIQDFFFPGIFQIFFLYFFSFSYKVHQPLLSFLPFSCPSCPGSSSQLDIIWPVNGTLLCWFLSDRLSRCHEQPQHWSLHKVGSSHSTRGRKLHPVNTQTLCAQLSFGSLEHHWRSIAYPDFVWVKTGLRQRGKWPRRARLWPRRRDHARTAGLWTSYPCVPGVNSLVATRVNQQ